MTPRSWHPAESRHGGEANRLRPTRTAISVWPHGGHSIFSLEMRLQDSKYKGSIHYAAQRFTGGEWDAGADGVKVCSNGGL